MDLTQLEMFNAVAEAGSITRLQQKCIACRRISLPVYVNWKQNWGLICLFARISVYVSRLPGITLRYSQQILALVDEARSVVAGDEPQGLFSLGSLESTAAVRIPATLAEFNRRYPKIQFHFPPALPALCWKVCWREN